MTHPDIPDIPGDNTSTVERESLLGLSRNLWRLAIVVGIAQFSISIWYWQFYVYLETIIAPWQMGLTSSIGTFSSLAGTFVAGTVSDMIGRRRTLAVAFLPIFSGLLLLSFTPTWPLIPVLFGIAMFGWSFVLIISRAIPADEISLDGGRNSAKRFTMVLMPAFLIDGLSPSVGASLLSIGLTADHLHLIAALSAIVAAIATLYVVRESLGIDIQERARAGPLLSFRKLGKNFWKLVVVMLPYYFCYNIIMTYYGNLIVSGWGIDVAIYGYTWSAFSLTGVAVMYFVSGATDRNVRLALFIALISNALILGLFSISSGVLSLVILNIAWAAPIMMWIGAERSLIVADVDETSKGRALSTFAALMSSTNLVAPVLGAWIWDNTNSLRTTAWIAFIGCFFVSVLVGLMLKTVQSEQD